MNYKELLIDSQRSGVSALLTFVLEYHEFDKVVACFVEGKDCSYYRSRVESNVNSDREVLFYPCNGKKDVESVKKMIEENLHLEKDVKKLYFCDSDYGIDDKIDGVFYTDFYSVENYYSLESFVTKIIENVFNINKHNPEHTICINLYKERYSKFNEQIKKLNAYCYGLRVKEKQLSRERTKFSHIKFRNIIDNEDFINYSFKNLDYDDIKLIVNSEVEITNQEYDGYIELIDEKKLRGKWELEFVEWFLEGLRIQIKNGTCGFSKNEKKIISFQNEMMTSMERYALTTQGLVKYIEHGVI